MSQAASLPRAPSPAPAQAPERDYRSWFRSFKDPDREHGFERLQVEGALPADLRGTYYRNGPGLFSNFGQGYGHWFDGDGAIAAVRLQDGRAEGAFRIIESEGLKKERDRGKSLFAGYGTLPPFWRRRPLHPVKNAANTSLLMHEGRLFALWEGGCPTEVDPETLQTLGERDLEGVIQRSFSAHPRYVAARKTTYNFGVRVGRERLLDLFALPEGRPCARLATLTLPQGCLVHDFAATPRHLIFFLAPIELSILPMLLSLGPFSQNLNWRPSLGTEILVVPIDAPDTATHFTTDAFWSWHVANAYEQGDGIVIEYTHYPDFSTNGWLGSIVGGVPAPATFGTFNRATLHVKGRRFETSVLYEGAVEFPRIAPHLGGDAHRFTWLGHQSPGAVQTLALQDGIARVDGHTGEAQTYTFPGDVWAGEPLFVPREGATQEDDGYILNLVYDAAEDLSALHIFRAHALKDGPIAQVAFDQGLPLGFHGTFAPGNPGDR